MLNHFEGNIHRFGILADIWLRIEISTNMTRLPTRAFMRTSRRNINKLYPTFKSQLCTEISFILRSRFGEVCSCRS